ncbi:OprO/OprP family phosphate-selective porin [Xanthomonas sp. NCPPB 1638]|uniref:Porin n=1 Tax=Xanthomonas cucurbitae TaxID=56453 RepID=A0A2S7DTH9_9XANT|nr:OprO/OprP family phosphate-selective porin [Xanthomonas cucurbitae]PPU77096.1 porin [Xanthomonas cucurbitae]WDM79479.1 OprO/OprP family phosphate-selective porin [Xanthomonas cucurbitae]WDM83167.1 OprO/OprP family phosphate-selective porin [Xanthomonas cucurbitae]
MKKRNLATVLCALGVTASGSIAAAELELYVDRKTKQIFAEPAPGRDKLGKFVQVDDSGKLPASALPAAPAPPPAVPGTAETAVAQAATVPAPVPAAAAKPSDAPKKWYDKLSLRGYTQIRYNHGIGGDAQDLRAPGDRFIGNDQSLGIRRARLVLSGDLNEYVSLYFQPDFASTPAGTNTTNFAQLRDAYADIYFDKQREYRVRVGQSKMPYGWENLQSSQNRLTLDRADALNSGLRDERDLGAVFYYSPTVAKGRFQDLVKSGLKGSGDYGVLGAGVYNGQGANRPERNDSMHAVVHATYPFKFANGQYLEVGADAYSGRFVPSAAAVNIGGRNFTPAITDPDGYTDQRVAAHIIYYPQPFGLQAEWTVGRGPELDVEQRRIRTRSLSGGYVQAMFKHDFNYGTLLPYLKWQTYRGGSKFDTNAPRMQLDEVEAGVEWQPMDALELVFAYSKMKRTDVTTAPYPVVEGDLLRVQLQVNY